MGRRRHRRTPETGNQAQPEPPVPSSPLPSRRQRRPGAGQSPEMASLAPPAGLRTRTLQRQAVGIVCRKRLLQFRGRVEGAVLNGRRIASRPGLSPAAMSCPRLPYDARLQNASRRPATCHFRSSERPSFRCPERLTYTKDGRRANSPKRDRTRTACSRGIGVARSYQALVAR